MFPLLIIFKCIPSGPSFLWASPRTSRDLLGAYEGLILRLLKHFSHYFNTKHKVQEGSFLGLLKHFSNPYNTSQGREGSPSLPRASQPPDPTKAFESSSSSCNSSTPSSPQVDFFLKYLAKIFALIYLTKIITSTSSR